MEIAIFVEGLVKRYGGRAVVDGLTFTVERGEVFALLGPNGAGKTTTVEILEGFRRADEGRTSVLGLDPVRDARALVRRVGVMPQESGFYAQARPDEALRLFASFYDNPLDSEELLSTVGLEDARSTPWRRLSVGERRRLSLALALTGRPEVIFLDEPTAGMDVQGRVTTWKLIRELRDGGATVFLTTHLLDEAERLADRVAIVHRGQLRALGRPSDLASRGDEGRLRFRASHGLDLAALSGVLGAPVSEERSGEYVVQGLESSPDTVARLASWLAERNVRIEDLTVGSRSLEDVFLELTEENAP